MYFKDPIMTEIRGIMAVNTANFHDPLVDMANKALFFEGPVMGIPETYIENLCFIFDIQDIRHTELILDLTGCLDSTVE